MVTTLYLVRHGKAHGQEPEAALTADGLAQAQVLAELLGESGVRQIVSSPYVRAVQSIEPLANRLSLPIETDDRLVEANLSTINYPDWLDRLKTTFSDFELVFEGGESSHAASERGIAAVEDALRSSKEPIAIVTHGRLMTLILKHFDSRFGFDNWKSLSAPDVFQVILQDEEAQVRRLWNVKS